MQPHICRHDTYDAVIVGARCAGAATGMLLASAGLRVLVFDKIALRERHPVDARADAAGGAAPAALGPGREARAQSGTPRVQRTTFRYADDQRFG